MKNIVAAAALMSSVCAVAHTEPMKFRCSAVKNTVHHSIVSGSMEVR